MTLFQRLPARLALSSRFPPPNVKIDKPNTNLGQYRTKRSAAVSDDNRKAVIFRAIASNNRSTKSSSGSEQQQVDGIFGLRPIDYSIVPPIPYSPPPPPAKPGLQKYLFPFTLAFTAATVGYFYMNNNNDNYEYWWVVDPLLLHKPELVMHSITIRMLYIGNL